MSTIKLPNNNFGCAIMLIALFLLFLTPTVIVAWLLSLITPLWVSIPCAVVAGFIAFVKYTTFK